MIDLRRGRPAVAPAHQALDASARPLENSLDPAVREVLDPAVDPNALGLVASVGSKVDILHTT
jgi:hypothetical protein